MNGVSMRQAARAGLCLAAVSVFVTGAVVMAQNKEAAKPALMCTLTTPELQARRTGVIERLRQSAEARRELADGWSLRYSERQVNELVEFIRLERQCCSFFAFSLSFEAGNGPVWLSITGPEGAKAMIAAEMAPISKDEADRPK